MNVVVLAGGFGGAKMAHGFALLGEQVELSVIVNTGDDLELHGLYVSPDLDTVMYTLAGLANTQTGWGVRDETWSASAMLARYGAETWFRLGDRDLATHIRRTELLDQGRSLTEATDRLSSALGLTARLLPMTDDPVRTKVRTPHGWLDFQDYFVRRGHRDEVLGLRFDGIEEARATAGVSAAIRSAEVVVIAPSNPFVSIGPILALADVGQQLLTIDAPVIAVSPIVAGAALRGPAREMLQSLGAEASAAGLARHYSTRYPGLIDAFVLDTADEADADEVAATGISPIALDIVMTNESDRRRLAEQVLNAILGRRTMRA